MKIIIAVSLNFHTNIIIIINISSIELFKFNYVMMYNEANSFGT